MIAGKEAVKPGEAKNSWLTGTAAWNFVAVSQHLLGVRPDYDGLIVDPCLPAEIPQFTVSRWCRGVTYVIPGQELGQGRRAQASGGRQARFRQPGRLRKDGLDRAGGVHGLSAATEVGRPGERPSQAPHSGN
jgi:hypothetical protein